MAESDTTDKPESTKAAGEPGGGPRPTGDVISTYMAALGKKGPAFGLASAVLVTVLVVVQANPKGVADAFISLATLHKEPAKEPVAEPKDHTIKYVVQTLDKYDVKPGVMPPYQLREFAFPNEAATEGTYQLQGGGHGNASKHVGHNGTLILSFYPSDALGMGMGAVVLRPRYDISGKPIWYSGFSLGHECLCHGGGANDGPFTVVPAVMKAQADVPDDELDRIMSKPYKRADFFFPDDLKTLESLPLEKPATPTKNASR